MEDLGDTVIAILTVGAQRVKVRLESYTTLAEGENVFLTFSSSAAHLFDSHTGERISSMPPQDPVAG